MTLDPREAFIISEPARLESPLGALDLGVVDAQIPGIAEGVSRLLVRSIQDAREETGGHLPSWLVRDIERNYISPAKVRTLWAATGHRFALVLDKEIVGTIHIAKSDAMILTVDRNITNVDERDHPGFKPARHHHVVNISVRHELRRAHLGRRMVEGIARHFRHLFVGEGLWVRADPPWHAGLSGLGFAHDPAFDVFLPPSAERTAGLPHDVFNQRYACDCGPRREELATHKLQYVSMTRPFERAAAAHSAIAAPSLDPPTDAYARDYGGTITLRPRAVVRPASIDELATILAWATREQRRVTIRGQGQSYAGQSLGDDVVLSTERLDRIISTGDDRVTVEGGITWRALAAGTAALPRVVPHVDASIGGTLASLGVGTGSIAGGLVIDQVESLVVVTGDGRRVECSCMQAGWLFEAVLGGHGQFGVIAAATLRAPVADWSFDGTGMARADDITAVLAAFDAPSAISGSCRIAHDGFHARTETSGSKRSIRTHVLELWRHERALTPTGFLQVVLPRSALAPFAAHVRACIDLSHQDVAAWIHPFIHRTARPGLFLPRLDVADGELVFAVSLMHSTDHPVSELVAEARRLGGQTTLQSGVDDWRAQLGDRLERALRAKQLADPAAILGSPHLRLDRSDPRKS